MASGVALAACEGPAGTAGQSGQNGASCTLTNNNDGSVTISCPGSAPVTVTNGQDGQPCAVSSTSTGVSVTCPGSDPVDVDNGQDAQPCTVNSDASGVTVTCPGSAPVTVANGSDGQSCAIQTLANGYTITCPGSAPVTITNGSNGVSTGSIALTVKDSAGAVIAGASASTNPATSKQTSATNGTATFSNVPVGTYTLTITESKHHDYVGTVSVTAGQTANVTAVMANGAPFSLIDVVGVSGAEGATDAIFVPTTGTLTLPATSTGSFTTSDALPAGVVAGQTLKIISATDPADKVATIITSVTAPNTFTTKYTAWKGLSTTVAAGEWTIAKTRVTSTKSPSGNVMTSGQRNVGVGTFVYLTGSDVDQDAWDNEKAANVAAWTWTLVTPGGSNAALEYTTNGDPTNAHPRSWSATPSQFARFRADVPGIYEVTLSITANHPYWTTPAETTTESTIEIYAGNYTGQSNCASCHANDYVVGAEKAVYNDFQRTGHATKFLVAYGSYGASDYCAGCHTTGYDETAGNGGTDDMFTLAGWTLSFPGFSSALGYVKATWPTLTSFLSDPKTIRAQDLVNIQCEACHGPGSNHPTAEAHQSWSGDVCKQCHGQPLQWELSKHAAKPPAHMAGSADCGRCHNGQGFVVGQIQGKALVFPNSATATTPANMFEYGNAQPIGCPACHDPHAFTYPYSADGGVTYKSDQLRLEGAVTAPQGFTVEAEKSAVCVKCHSNKRDAQYLVDYLAGKNDRGVHDNPQADMLEGAGAYEYSTEFTTAPSYSAGFHATAVAGKCVECHMSKAPVSGGTCSVDSDCAGYGNPVKAATCVNGWCTALCGLGSVWNVTLANCAVGDTVTVTVNSTSYDLVADTDFMRGAADTDLCTNLAAAIDALPGVGASCTSGAVKLTPDAGTTVLNLTLTGGSMSAFAKGACDSPADTCSKNLCVAQKVGGHTFSMSNAGADHVRACSSCHGNEMTTDFDLPRGDFDCNGTAAGVQTEVSSLLNLLGQCLRQNEKLRGVDATLVVSAPAGTTVSLATTSACAKVSSSTTIVKLDYTVKSCTTGDVTLTVGTTPYALTASSGCDALATAINDLGLTGITAACTAAETSGGVGSAGAKAASPAERKALWNYFFVKNDGSRGVHNASYAVELLVDSFLDLNAMSTDYCTTDTALTTCLAGTRP